MSFWRRVGVVVCRGSLRREVALAGVQERDVAVGGPALQAQSSSDCQYEWKMMVKKVLGLVTDSALGILWDMPSNVEAVRSS
jgi:hypothetical protein